jgi:hypothetical protein
LILRLATVEKDLDEDDCDPNTGLGRRNIHIKMLEGNVESLKLQLSTVMVDKYDLEQRLEQGSIL